MSWIKRMFKSGKATEEKQLSKEDSLIAKLEIAIENCKLEIKKAGDESDQLKAWAIDAIREVFEVPNRFWYEELKRYQEIRNLDENKSVDYQVITKCDQVVEGYLGEIELRTAKTVLYQSLIGKYQVGKDKVLQIKNKKENEHIAQTKLELLEKHSRRLEQLQSGAENFASHIDESNQLDMISEEINEVYDEFEISEEVREHFVKIENQFRTSSSGFSSKMAIEEIEELMKKIKQDK